MVEPTSSGSRRSWDYPECPNCETDLLVDGDPGKYGESFICRGCGERIEPGDESG